ncbi:MULTISPECIES: DUF6179 domain-containing protein [unclassified Clostridium]|uniref:DUF6179 domain-containing protein n=1 Tax=unclassified Clostridium TaxID=2614128 RepID=UPI00189C29EF|nr:MULTISPECIES: DUF6179 domain-containing protein [unclassified Clostridium]MCR1951117.1 DUF6179 domain-containing protein [Clostridium sp. DSM 100503]
MSNLIINNKEGADEILNQENYFQSLLQYSYNNNLLDKEDFEKVQIQIMNILKDIVTYYTMDSSSSVRVEVAESLLSSIYYTISLFIKNNSNANEAIKILKEESIKEIFNKGEKLLRVKFDDCISLLSSVQKTKLIIKNYAYNDTIDYGIPLFFKKYDIRYGSHETPGSIDYPLSNDNMNLVGIEYIENYLKKLNLENKFCSNFNTIEIEDLLNGYDKKSYHLLINIFDLVLTNSIGSVFLNKEASNLRITPYEKLYLKERFINLSEKEIKKEILLAVERICIEFLIDADDLDLVNYLNNASVKISHELNRDINQIDRIFITPNNEKEKTIKYQDRKSVENSIFRNISEEVRTCSNVEDKIKIIKEDIHSLTDLVDLLGADCIFEYEFTEVFKALDDFEIALLIKYLPRDKDVESDYGTESEKEWHEKLLRFIDSLDEIKRRNILRLSSKFEI